MAEAVAARYRAWGKRKQKDAVIHRVVEVVEKIVPVEKVVTVQKVVERLPSTEEMLKRISYDTLNHRIVYKSPDTGRVIEVLRIPDQELGAFRKGKESRDQLSAMGARFMRMDNANMRRAMEANPNAFFGEVRSLAASVVSQDTTKGKRKLPRTRRAGTVPINTATASTRKGEA